MTQERDLLRMIALEPDDDAPRLVFADWCEDNGMPDRAEFIRAQVCLEAIRRAFPVPDREALESALYGITSGWTCAGDSPERRQAAFRARRLLDAHESEWVRSLGGAGKREVGWSRGFVEVVDADPAVLEASGSDLFDLHPIRRLLLTGMSGNLGALRLIPAENRLRALELLLDDINHDALLKLPGFTHLGGLEELSLMFNRLRDSSIPFLCSEPFFQRLSLLRLTGNQFTQEGRDRLREHFGERVRFDRHRHPNRLFAFRDSPEQGIQAGFVSDFTQVLLLADAQLATLLVFDHVGDLLGARMSSEGTRARGTWLARLDYQPATIRIKRIRDVWDFEKGWAYQFDSPDDEPQDYANAREFLQRWLAAGAYRYGSCCGGHWFNANTGEPLALTEIDGLTMPAEG
jgi:uncharacterized protein (TIGR02996 family)